MKTTGIIPWLCLALTALLVGCGGASYDAAMAPPAEPRREAYGSSGGYPQQEMGGDATVTADSGGDSDSDGEEYAAKADEGPMPAPAGAKMAPEAPPAPPPVANTTPPSTKPGGQGPSTAEKRQPILIYTANFTMSVYEVKKSLDALEGLAKSVGGFVSRRDDRSITLRVPAADFAGAVVELEKLGDVLNRNVVAEDVTAEYRDLEVQLQNLAALRSRFEKLLEKAQKVEEALQIERELGRITGEMERIKGRIKVLNDQAQYSTITVVFQPRSAQQIQDGPFVLPLPWLNRLGLPRLLAL